ncbi:MAG: hypothetical protein M0Q15_16125 [Nevskia sp.]|jgi:hypothetical protein|nr:hypothetical protein [Nevskia sp.]
MTTKMTNTAVDTFLDMYDFSIGDADAGMVARIMAEGEAVGFDLAYDLTGKPDQYLTIPQALRLAGCKDA